MDFEKAAGRTGSSPTLSWAPPALPGPLGPHPVPSLSSRGEWAAWRWVPLPGCRCCPPPAMAPDPAVGPLQAEGQLEPPGRGSDSIT